MNKDNKKILDDVKLKISISNFQEKESYMEKKNTKNLLKKSLIAGIIIVSTTGVVFARDIGEFIKNKFGNNASDGVESAVQQGYISDVKTEYQDADGIEVKVDSFVMDDFNFAMNFKITVNEKYNIENFKSVALEDLRITDETGKVVFVTHEADEGKDKPEYWGAYSMGTIEKNENEIILALTATGNPEAFPRSKKLNVKFSKLSTKVCDERYGENKTYVGNWNFDIDVPAEFYNRETIIYRATKCNEESIDLTKIQVKLSKTALKISIPEINSDNIDYELLHTSTPKSIFDKIAIQKEYVETSDGKKFEPARRSDGDGGYGVPAGENKIINYYQTFNLTSYDATDVLKIHMTTNKGTEIIIELERK